MARNWRWNPRLDLDLAQRCLFIILAAWSMSTLLSSFLPSFVMLILSTLIDVVAVGALIVAIAKSSIQLTPANKAVLVTGKMFGPHQQLLIRSNQYNAFSLHYPSNRAKLVLTLHYPRP